MKIKEFIINEDAEVFGMDAISMVEFPAIESNFLHLNHERVALKTIDEEKRIIMGAALIPNKPIYRVDDEGNEYYGFFSPSTVRRGAELFFREGFHKNVNIEHGTDLVDGVFFFESWIIEGEQDKSRIHGLNEPIETWMVTAKVENEDVWNDYVKTGKVKGWSIEGYFADKSQKMNVVEELKNIFDASGE